MTVALATVSLGALLGSTLIFLLSDVLILPLVLQLWLLISSGFPRTLSDSVFAFALPHSGLPQTLSLAGWELKMQLRIRLHLANGDLPRQIGQVRLDHLLVELLWAVGAGITSGNSLGAGPSNAFAGVRAALLLLAVSLDLGVVPQTLLGLGDGHVVFLVASDLLLMLLLLLLILCGLLKPRTAAIGIRQVLVVARRRVDPRMYDLDDVVIE